MSRLGALRDRAWCFAIAREFFAHRQILEVDCPALAPYAPIDEHIDVFRVLVPDDKIAYLHTSPEYGMKRLLSEGIGDIYQISHVFREGEVGALHNPEFTLAEWYRVEMRYDVFMEETLDFIRLFLGPLPSVVVSYRDTFLHYADVDPLLASLDVLRIRSAALGFRDLADDRDTLLHFLLASVVQPHLGADSLYVLTDYPASQAALACTRQKNGALVAERFEVYYRGIELASGYHELTDSDEQRRRLNTSEMLRRAHNKPPLPIDESFLCALSVGIPDCCGVAVGIDRLLLLRQHATSLAQVMPFAWNRL